ncbi:hypothetical protein BD779DRAFT_1469301 [Infundibulicybe gibba]|nr:hypothetical protein BD779DRAFT_1469301 [Infundibulicybe gibba]
MGPPDQVNLKTECEGAIIVDLSEQYHPRWNGQWNLFYWYCSAKPYELSFQRSWARPDKAAEDLGLGRQPIWVDVREQVGHSGHLGFVLEPPLVYNQNFVTRNPSSYTTSSAY